MPCVGGGSGNCVQLTAGEKLFLFLAGAVYERDLRYVAVR